MIGLTTEGRRALEGGTDEMLKGGGGYKHGHTEGGVRSIENEAWHAMIQRCENRNARSWPRYGGRGIRVCYRWRISFENFLADMGFKPSRKHSLDRIDNNGNYTPENCRWATIEEQMANRPSYQLAKTHCPKGHPYSGENLRIKPDGRRVCRACNRRKKEVV